MLQAKTGNKLQMLQTEESDTALLRWKAMGLF